MEKDLLDLFDISYTNSVTSSHVVFTARSDLPFYIHQLKMLGYNQKSLKTVIPPDYRKRNDSTEFFYDITSKKTLTDFLYKNILNKEEVIHILSGIVETLCDCESYLLSADKFVLDTDYMYIDPDGDTIRMIYLPVKQSFDATEQLKKFLIEFISLKAKISTEQNDNYTQRILEYIKEDHVSIRGIKSLLEQLGNNAPLEKQERDQKESHFETYAEFPYNPGKHPDQASEKSKINLKKRTSEKPKSMDVKITGIRSLPEECYEKVKRTNGKARHAYLLLFLIGILAFIFIAGTVLIGRGGKGQKGLQIFGLFILLSGIGYIFFNRFGRKKTGENEDSKERLEKTEKEKDKPKLKEKQINIPIPVFQSVKEEKKEAPVEKNGTFIPSDKHINTENEKLMHTVVLSGGNRKVLYLHKSGSNMKIFITATPFVLGRLREFSDFAINNPAIGKSHCEISYDDNGVYVKDLDSKNGTYVNDIKLEPGRRVTVQDGDRLGIANESFVIKYPAD
jgi:pSer/pThr/pTyr-binding forkhead associated (FHA) protein